MKKFLWLACGILLAAQLYGQSFELSPLQEAYKGYIGETIKAPLRLRNTSDKPVTLVIRRLSTQIGGTQKNYYCVDNNCLDQRVEDYSVKIDPNQTINAVQLALDAGLAHGTSAVRYIVFNKSNPADNQEFEVFFTVEEKAEKQSIYTSNQIDLHDVYPNPMEDYAFINYRIFDEQVKAKIVLHNILGNPIEEYNLPPSETRVKIRAEALSAGVYFYTLYVNKLEVITKKIVRR